MIDSSYVADGAVVIDVGINVDEEGNLCGDVNFDDMRQIEDHINPIFTKFSVNDFAVPSTFMEYNRGIIINSEDIIKTLKGE